MSQFGIEDLEMKLTCHVRDRETHLARKRDGTQGKTRIMGIYEVEAYLAMANCDTLEPRGTLWVGAALGPERK
jgi:hypothetical protein